MGLMPSEWSVANKNKCPSWTLILGTWNQALISVTPCFKGVTLHKGLAELFWFCSVIPTPYHSKRIQKQMSLLKSKSQWVDISPMKQTSAEDRFHLITHPPNIHWKHTFLAVLYIFIRWTIFWRMFIRCYSVLLWVHFFANFMEQFLCILSSFNQCWVGFLILNILQIYYLVQFSFKNSKNI